MKTLFPLVSLILSLSVVNSVAGDADIEQSVNSKIQKAQLAEKQKKKSTIVFNDLSVTSSPAKQYQTLVLRKEMLTADIEAINVSLVKLSKSKAKKAVKRIKAMEVELNSVTKAMSLFPKSITENGYAQKLENEQKEQFLASLNEKTDKLIAQNDPYAGQMSLDTEVEKSYREFIQNGEQVAFETKDFAVDNSSNNVNAMINNHGQFYSVLFAIATKPINTKMYPYPKVYTQKLKNGTVAYFAGAFENEQDAKKICSQILAKGQFRDSFVVLIK